MISNPNYGWCTVALCGRGIGPASSLTNVPLDCLEAMRQALTRGTDFFVSFDAEGWEFKLIADTVSTYVIFLKDDVTVQEFPIGKLALAKELVSDIRGNLAGWTQFCSMYADSPEKYQKTLSALCDIVEAQIKAAEKPMQMELGNLLFGHSRGEYQIDRESCQKLFDAFLEETHCDGYGYAEKDDLYANERGGLSTDTFCIRPYYWGEDEKEAELPNFEYFKDKLEIRWYKYPVRDAYANKPVDAAYLRAVLADCKASLTDKPLVMPGAGRPVVILPDEEESSVPPTTAARIPNKKDVPVPPTMAANTTEKKKEVLPSTIPPYAEKEMKWD